MPTSIILGISSSLASAGITTSAFVGGLITVGVQVGVGALANFALSALGSALSSGGATGTSQGLLVNDRSPSSPQQYVYGLVRKGGTISYLETNGYQNNYLHQFIVLAGHPVDGIEAIYINDEVADIDNTALGFQNVLVQVNYTEGGVSKTATPNHVAQTGFVTGQSLSLTELILLSNQWSEYFENPDRTFVSASVIEASNVSGGFVGGKWGGKIRIIQKLGIQTEVDANFFAETSNPDILFDPSGNPYTQSTCPFVGRGLTYLYVRFEYDPEIFASGIPLITAVVRGKEIKNSITGITDYSINPANMIRDYLTSDLGLNVSEDKIDEDSFRQAALDCEELASLSDGSTQVRFASNGVISSGEPVGSVLDKMVTSCAGVLYWSSGKWKLKAGTYKTPTVSFTEDNFRSPISMATKVAMRDNFNIVQGTYINEHDDWISSDFPQVTNASFVAEDNGVEQTLDVQFPFTTNVNMAYRIAEITLNKNREQITFTGYFDLTALECEVGDTVQITNSRYGWVNETFEVVEWKLLNDPDQGGLVVEMTLRETSQAAYSLTPTVPQEGTPISNLRMNTTSGYNMQTIGGENIELIP